MKKILLGILIGIISAALCWIITCGLVWLIAWCFDLPFTWKIGTGVFLIIFTINWAIKFKVKISKD